MHGKAGPTSEADEAARDVVELKVLPLTLRVEGFGLMVPMHVCTTCAPEA